MRWALLAALLAAPQAAGADPISAFFYGIQTALTGAAVGASVSLAFQAGYSMTLFASTRLGSLLLGLGVSYALQRLRGQPEAPGIPDSQVNVRLEDAPRWIAGGTAAVGGAAGIFMEFDEDGNFWYVVAHADAELTGDPAYILDGIPVELSDGSDGFTAGDVITDAFCVTSDGKRYEGTGTKLPVWRIYTVSPSSSSPYGTKPEAFTTAFPSLPADFWGTGVTWSILRGRALEPQNRPNGYRWRGAIGIGEPSVLLVGNWTRMYDPREPGHDIDDPSTWTPSNGNAEIVWAWFRTTARGRGQAMSDVNWDKVAEWADICDLTVLDRSGDSTPLYRAGVAFPDNRPRHECEADILRAMDGFVAYDEEGRAYAVPGYYEEPTHTFTGARDILSAQTQVIDDGEQPLDGVIVRFISPEHGYTLQPSAPWRNTAWYDGVSEPNYETLDAPACQNHNQAVRLAKGYGQRRGATRKGAFATTIKGILLKSERGLVLDYDAQFDGVFEIVTPVEEDPSGQACRFAVVPLGSDRWTLGEGEEGAPPQDAPALEIDTTLELAANVAVTAATIRANGSWAVRLEATFDAPGRVDRFFRFRFIPVAGGTPHEFMVTDMEGTRAYSALVDEGVSFRVSWQTVTAGGRATVWSDERDTPAFIDITATAETPAPVALADLEEPGALGQSLIVTGWRGDDVAVDGDGVWWRDRASGEVVTNARYVGAFQSGDHQIDTIEKDRDDILSHGRSTVGTYKDQDGLIKTAAADVLRYDWSTGKRALLLEPAATNLHTFSDDYANASWTKANVTVASNAVDAPAQGVLADTITATGGGLPQIYDVVSTTAGPHTSSVWMKLGTLAASDFLMAVRNDTTGTFIFPGDLPAGFTPSALLWQRCSLAYTMPVGSALLRFYPLRSGNSGATGTVHLWNAQTEPGSEPSSDILTGAAAVTRAADVVSMQGISTTLDLTATYGDGSTDDFPGVAVSPGYWPALTDRRLLRLVGRTP